MTRNRKEQLTPRPRFADRFQMWLSSGKEIDGLWVGTYFQTHAEEVMSRVEAALDLIKTHDRPRYARLAHDLDQVWVRLLTVGVAQFDPSWRGCSLDERFVLAENTDTADIASAIVHEATHARLWRYGFRYDEDIRQRVEAICLRREVAFARKLPDGARVRAWAEETLAFAPTYWTDTAAVDRENAGAIAVLDHVGISWLTRFVLAVRKWQGRPAGDA